MAETTLLSFRPTRLIAIHYYVAATFLWIVAAVAYIFPTGAIANWEIPLLGWRLKSLGAALLAFLGLLLLLFAELRRLSTRYVVTDSRIMRYDGILSKKTNQMPFNKVERVEMHQSFFQRIFRFGDILLDTGEDTITFASVGHVNLVQDELSKLVATYSKRG